MVNIYEDLTVEGNLLFFGGIYGLSPARSRERAQELLSRMDLSERRRDLSRHLAKGLRQRLALASAIIHEPAILFLDEPTSGVDPLSRRKFWDLISDMADAGVTTLVESGTAFKRTRSRSFETADRQGNWFSGNYF